MSDRGLSVGLEVSSDGVSLALACNEAFVQPVVQIGLPVIYRIETRPLLPLSLSDRLSDLPVIIPTRSGPAHQTSNLEMMRRSIKAALQEAADILNRKIDLICAAVPSSFSERDRARFRSLLREFGCDAYLYNEDQAVLAASPDLRRTESLLIYNMLSRSIEMHYYRLTSRGLSLERLEVLENCGLDMLDFQLIDRLMENRRGPEDLRRFHGRLSEVRIARSAWLPGQPLNIPLGRSLGFSKEYLPSEEVAAIFENALGASFDLARQMVPHEESGLKAVVISPNFQDPYILNRLRQSLGVEVEVIGREKVLEGAALNAWAKSGGPTAVLDSSRSLPIIKPYEPENHTSPSPGPEAAGAPKTNQHPRVEDNSIHPVMASIRLQFMHLLDRLKPLDLETLLELLSPLQEAGDEFLARSLDIAAKKMVERQDYESAYQVYKEYWSKGGGFGILSQPAAGLCLARLKMAGRSGDSGEAEKWGFRGWHFEKTNPDFQVWAYQHCHHNTVAALRHKNRKQAKKWCKYGLEIDNRRPELKELKKEWRL